MPGRTTRDRYGKTEGAPMQDVERFDFASRSVRRVPWWGLGSAFGRGRGTLEQNLTAEGSKDPQGSIASWVLNFDSLYTNRIQSLLARGKYAEASALYEEANSAISENEDSLFALMNLPESAGEAGRQIAGKAKEIANNPFRNVAVEFNGTNMPLDAVLRNGGELAMSSARDEFDALGLSRSVAEAFFNGPDQQRAAVRSLVQPLLQKDGRGAGDWAQRIELAEDVVNHWDELSSLFGDGVTYFVNRLQSLHSGAGGASDTLRTLMTVARSSSDASSGKDLARSVMGQYEALVSRVFAGDTSVNDAGGRPKDSSPSPVKRLDFDAALAASVKAVSARGGSLDLRNPAFSSALAEVMDMQAWASDSGVDLIGLGHDAGRPASNAFGEYVADMVTGVPPTGANPVNALRALRSRMDSTIVGGNDFATQVYRLTGNPQDYLANLDKANGGFSSSRGADGMARGIKSFLIKKMAPGIMGGMSPDDALNAARSGGPHAGVDFLVGLSDTIAQYMSGQGKHEAADLLASRMMSAIDSGNRASVEDSVADLAYGTVANEADVTDGVQALRDWYHGNFVLDREYAQKVVQLRAHYVNDEQLPDQMAAANIAKLSSQASQMARLGRDGSKVFDAALRVGTVYVPVTDPTTGQPVVGPGGLPSVRKLVADRTQYGYVVGGDNSAYDARQRAYAQDYQNVVAYNRAAATAAGRKSESEDA